MIPGFASRGHCQFMMEHNGWHLSKPVTAVLSKGNRSECHVKVDFISERCLGNYNRCHNSICKVSQKIELFAATYMY